MSTSRRALVIRHHEEDRAGLVGEALEERGFVLRTELMDENSPTPDLDEVDLLVVLGSKHAVYDPEVEAAWFGRELGLLADAGRREVPIFGICFGAQALCRHHGGIVRRADEAEIGWFEVDPVASVPLPAGPWFEYHFDRCELPESAQLWASSPRAVQAFAIGRDVGVQFHPEVDEHQLADWMGAGGAQETRDLGLDPDGLLARTAAETPAARARVAQLVDLVLAHIAASA